MSPTPPRRTTYEGGEERTPLPASPAERERLIAEAAFDALKAVREQAQTVGQLVQIIQGTPTRPEEGLLWRVLEQERKDVEREKRRRFWSHVWITALGGVCLALATWVARLYARFP